MHGIIDVDRNYRQLLGLCRNHPKFPRRVIRNRRRLCVLYTRWKDEPIVFHVADVHLGNKSVLVMSSSFDEYWHPVVKEDGIPLYVHDLVDRGFLEQWHRDAKLWKGNE